jgi:hypothetical protein
MRTAQRGSCWLFRALLGTSLAAFERKWEYMMQLRGGHDALQQSRRESPMIQRGNDAI